MELGRAGWRWMELGGGGWSWVEVGAWFSNTHFVNVIERSFRTLLCSKLQKVRINVLPCMIPLVLRKSIDWFLCDGSTGRKWF